MGAAQSEERDCVERVCDVNFCAGEGNQKVAGRSTLANLKSSQDPLLWGRQPRTVPFCMHSSVRPNEEFENSALLAGQTPTAMSERTLPDSARSGAATPPYEGTVTWDPDYGQKIVFKRELTPPSFKTSRSFTPNYVSLAGLNQSELASTDLFGKQKLSPFTKFIGLGRRGIASHSLTKASPLRAKDAPIAGLQVHDDESTCSGISDAGLLTEV